MAGKLKIAVLGATGNSGIQVLQQALDRGHIVKALVRSPEKVTIEHDNLQVVKSDLYDPVSLKNGMNGCDTVISCIGARGKMAKGTSLYLETMRVITTAMRDSSIKRVVAMSSWGTYRDSRSPAFIEYFFRFIIASVLESMREMEVYLDTECKDLDYTVVRPAGLTDKEMQNGDLDVEVECPCVPQGWTCAPKIMISRADVARFMLDIAENNQYTKKAVSIAL